MPKGMGYGDKVNTGGFRLDNSSSQSNEQRSKVGPQGEGGMPAGQDVPGTSNPKGMVPKRIGGMSRRSQGDLMQGAVDDSRFTTSEGKK